MQPSTIKTVEDTVLGFYLEYQESLTVMEIMGECHMSETIIRKVVTNSSKIRSTKKDVPIMSKKYPGRVHQTRSIDAFHPTREWLCEIIKETRREYDYFRYTRGRGFK